MGRAKALLPFGGRPLVTHVVTTLRTLCPEVVVVAAPDQELPPLAATIVHDEIAHQGPVGGLCYGLAAVTGEVAIAVACDSPFLSVPLLAHLLDQMPDHDIVVPIWGERLQPLHAVYRKTILPVVERQLASGALRPVDLFAKVRTLTVAEGDVRRIDPDGSSFFNMNTPEEYAAALARWERERAVDGAAAADQIRCTVELFGVARLLAHVSEVTLVLPAEATLAQALAALAARLPVLVGRVIGAGRDRLVDGCACNVNGLVFARTPDARIADGDRLVILPADAGG